jgi:hypothetical protein
MNKFITTTIKDFINEDIKLAKNMMIMMIF